MRRQKRLLFTRTTPKRFAINADRLCGTPFNDCVSTVLSLVLSCNLHCPDLACCFPLFSIVTCPNVAVCHLQVETLYLKPDPRVAIGELRRRRHKFDVFVNLYDLSDCTGATISFSFSRCFTFAFSVFRFFTFPCAGEKITQFLGDNGYAFTGGDGRFYDPPRRDLKTVNYTQRTQTPPLPPSYSHTNKRRFVTHFALTHQRMCS